MKTTLDIAGSLLTQAKQLASARSTTLRQIVEEGLRNLIEARSGPAFRLRDGSFGGNATLSKKAWAQMRDEIYHGRGA